MNAYWDALKFDGELLERDRANTETENNMDRDDHLLTYTVP
jgi:hypothetical protein